MSNEQLTKYKELYSQLVSHFANLHNYHHTFINSPSSKNGVDTRKSIKSMIDIETKMRRLSATVSREHRKNVKDGIKAEKRELARVKSLPKKRGRPPTKGKQNVINTTN